MSSSEETTKLIRLADISDQLRQSCVLFQEMSNAELKQVVTLLHAQEFPKDKVILREGKSVQRLWILTHGQCEVVKAIDEDGHQQLAVLEAGAVFGEMSFFRPGPHSASVKSLTPVKLYSLPREEFEELIETGSSAAYRIAVNLNRILSERLARMDDWICHRVEGTEEKPVQKDEWKDFRSRLYSEWQF